jgi:MoaA/NifB/PqqE/SkfB family radical SAM enzyme
MLDSVFQKAIEDYVEIGGGDLAIACTVGDPLLDKGIIKKIELARSFAEIGHIGLYKCH